MSEEPRETPEAGFHLAQVDNRKLQIARAQLGTALSLFLQDKDPFSVQALACGGAELIEGLALSSGTPTLSTHIIKTFPDMDYKTIGHRRSRYWNAIKHFYQMDKKTPRDDEALLSNFSDVDNDSALFAGWFDYLSLTKRVPVEVQVFQVWWYALNEDKMNPNVDRTPFRITFPGMKGVDRREQKRRLRRKIEAYRHNKSLLADPRTEVGPLIIRS